MCSWSQDSRTCTPIHHTTLPPGRDSFIHSQSCYDHPPLPGSEPRGRGGSQAPLQKLSASSGRQTQPHPFTNSVIQHRGPTMCCTMLGVEKERTWTWSLPCKNSKSSGEGANTWRVSQCFYTQDPQGHNKARVSLQGADTHLDLNRTERRSGGGQEEGWRCTI